MNEEKIKKKSRKQDSKKAKQKVTPTKLAALPSPSHPATSEEKAANTDKEEKDSSKRGNWWNQTKTIDRVKLILGGLTAIGAVIAVIISAKALKTTKDIFTNSNTPYLQVGDIKLNGDTVFYSIANFGQYPAKILQGRFGAIEMSFEEGIEGVDIENPAITKGPLIREDSTGKLVSDYKYIHLFDSTLINTYVVKEYPIRRHQVKMKTRYPFSKPKYYFFGEILYTNEVNGEKRKYIFNVILPQIEFVSNTNKDE